MISLILTKQKIEENKQIAVQAEDESAWKN
jgi:hypothetical protein